MLHYNNVDKGGLCQIQALEIQIRLISLKCQACSTIQENGPRAFFHRLVNFSHSLASFIILASDRRSSNVHVGFIIPELKLDVGGPTMVIGLPIHPPLEDLAGTGHIAEHLLHVNEIIPELIDARQQRHSAVADVPGMVYKQVLHLDLGITKPHSRVLVIHLHHQGPFPYRSHTGKVLLTLLHWAYFIHTLVVRLTLLIRSSNSFRFRKR